MNGDDQQHRNEPKKKGKRQKNIRPAGAECVVWDSNKPAESLEKTRTLVDTESQKAIDWYWSRKRWKSFPSQAIQFLALVLTAAAGIVPIVVQILKNAGKADRYDSGPVASLLVVVAGALLGLDKAFGYSSGWTRYVLTATSMTKLLHEFRMDWVALEAAAGASPSVEKQTEMIQRAKDFVSTMQGMVLQETKDWATEFQSNMAQMEKDLKSQLDALKAQVEKAAQEKAAAAKSGAIQLTVTNADKTDGFRFDVALEKQGVKITDSVSNAKEWVQTDIAPGQYKITVTAKSNVNPVASSAVVDVKPAEIEKPSITLPIS